MSRRSDPSGSGPRAKLLLAGRGCNNNCITCPYSGRSFEGNFRNAIAEKGDCEQIIFSGREPTTLPDFLELVELARKMDYKVIQVVTNGRVFSVRDFAERALQAGMNEVLVKLFSHDPGTHDRMARVPGAWSQTVRGILNLVKAGRKLGPYFRPTVVGGVYVTEQNFPHIEGTLKLLERLGADEAFLIRVSGPEEVSWKSSMPVFTIGFRSGSRYEDYVKRERVLRLE